MIKAECRSNFPVSPGNRPNASSLQGFSDISHGPCPPPDIILKSGQFSGTFPIFLGEFEQFSYISFITQIVQFEPSSYFFGAGKKGQSGPPVTMVEFRGAIHSNPASTTPEEVPPPVLPDCALICVGIVKHKIDLFFRIKRLTYDL